MRPNSPLHLGHYFGALQHWKKIQYEYDCLFMVADVHSLVQNFNETEKIIERLKAKELHQLVTHFR